MPQEISWLSSAVGKMYSNLLNNVGPENFDTKVVRVLYPDWSVSYINKNLHELARRGWAKRTKKGIYRLIDFKEIAGRMTPKASPLDVFLEFLDTERFVVTSYLASQLVTNYIHTAPKVTILTTREHYKEIYAFLTAKTKFIEKNTFAFFDSRVKIILKLVHPLKFKKILENSKKIDVASKRIRVTDPATTLSFLSKEKEDRKYADIAYLLMKTRLETEDLKSTLKKDEIKEVEKMINYKKDRLIHSTSMEILEMNMAASA